MVCATMLLVDRLPFVWAWWGHTRSLCGGTGRLEFRGLAGGRTDMGDSAGGSRNVEVYEKVEQVGEGTYGCERAPRMQAVLPPVRRQA